MPSTTPTRVRGAGKLCDDDTAQPLLRGGLLGVAGNTGTGAGAGVAGSTVVGDGGTAGSVTGATGSVGVTGLSGDGGFAASIGVQYMRDGCGPWHVPFLPSNVHGVPSAEPIQMARAGSIGPTSALAPCALSNSDETTALTVSAILCGSLIICICCTALCRATSFAAHAAC